MRKRVLSIVMCLVIIVSATVTGVMASAETVPEFDETKPYLKATSEPVMAGEIATVVFEIGNNDSTDTHKGFWGMRHTLTFDNRVLSFVEGETNEYGTFPQYQSGTDFSNTLISPIGDEGEFVFLYTNSLGNIINTTKNGVLFTINFKVADDAEPGTYYFEYKDYDAKNVINISNNSVKFTYNRPYVTVYDENTPPSTQPSSTQPSSTQPSSTQPSSSTQNSKDPSVNDQFDDLTKPTDPTVKLELKAPVLSSAKLSGKKSVKLMWSKSENAVSYQVYRAKNSSKSFVNIGTVKTTTFTDKKADGAAKYTYKIRAINGDKYADSNVKSVSVMNFKVKAKARATSTKKAMTVKISKKVKYAGGYQVSYSTSSKFKKKVTKTATIKSQKKFKKLKTGTKYYVRVRAYQKINGKNVYGSWSKKVSVKIK